MQVIKSIEISELLTVHLHDTVHCTIVPVYIDCFL